MHRAWPPHSSIKDPLSSVSNAFYSPLTKPVIVYIGGEEITRRRRLGVQIVGELCIRHRLFDVHRGWGLGGWMSHDLVPLDGKLPPIRPLLEPDFQCRQRSLRFAE